MKYSGKHTMRAAILAAALLSLQSASVSAEEMTAAASGSDELSMNDFSGAALMDDSELSKSRGGDSKTILNLSQVTGSVEGNTVNGGTTGDNTISDGSLGFNGIGTVFQNSGNNVLLQSSTVVNLTVCGGTC